MRFVSHLLEATITLVVLFGFLDMLLGGARPSRALARYSGLAEAEAWVTGFGGTTGWDGSPPRHSRAVGSARLNAAQEEM